MNSFSCLERKMLPPQPNTPRVSIGQYLRSKSLNIGDLKVDLRQAKLYKIVQTALRYKDQVRDQDIIKAVNNEIDTRLSKQITAFSDITDHRQFRQVYPSLFHRYENIKNKVIRELIQQDQQSQDQSQEQYQRKSIQEPKYRKSSNKKRSLILDINRSRDAKLMKEIIRHLDKMSTLGTQEERNNEKIIHKIHVSAIKQVFDEIPINRVLKTGEKWTKYI